MSDDPLLAEFLAESREHLQLLDNELVGLEQTPDDRERLGRIFRSIHTIKGTSGLLGYPGLEAVAHAAETVLGRLRDGRLRCDGPIASALLASIDAIRALVNGLEASGEEPPLDFDELIDHLGELAASAAARPPAPAQAPAPAAQAALPPAAEAAPAPEGALPEGTVRIDVRLLDTLLNLVGELVLTRNQMLDRNFLVQDPSRTLDTLHYLDSVTTRLQRTVTKTRMQPIATLYQRFHRLVRDLAHTCGKQVRLELNGGETELDRSLLEAMRDPLTHLVRNAIDHGLETPAERESRGKPPVGLLQVAASHRGGQVHLDISDDGAGIDPRRIERRAIERGLITEAQAQSMTDKDIMHLIFLPGFSTATEVTRVSGRGVGMDVVLSNVARIGGTIDVESTVGQGTRLRLKLPLTLAIIPALIVRSGRDLFAIPQVNLIELVRLEGDALQHAIEPIAGAPMLHLREQLLPLVFLSTELDGPPPAVTPDSVLNIVVLQADVRQFAMVVDGVQDVMEIVVKPLGRVLKPIPIYAGATLLSDGSLILILDVLGLARSARIVSEAAGEQPLTRASAPGLLGSQATAMLVVSGGNDDRFVVPMVCVLRVDTLLPGDIEPSAAQEVVQHDFGILPLLRVEELVTGRRIARERPLELVACDVGGHRFGLLVERVLDVVDEVVDTEGEAVRANVRRRVVVNGRVAEELDMEALSRQAFPLLRTNS